MTLRIECSACQRSFEAADEAAGRKVRCPACGAVSKLPAAPSARPADEGYALEERVYCPGCRRDWPAGTVLCVQCGYDFRKGKKRDTTYNVRDRALDGVFRLGCGYRYALRREGRQKVSFIIQTFLFFIPLPERRFDLRGYDTVTTDYRVSGFGQRRTEWYTLQMRGPRKGPVTIYEGAGAAMLKDIADLLEKGAGLTVKRV